MSPRRRALALPFLLVLGSLLSCEEVEEAFPASGTLAMSLVDTALRSQLDQPAGNQAMVWVIETATAAVSPGAGSSGAATGNTFDFNPEGISCGHVQRQAVSLTVPLDCGVFGFAQPVEPFDARVEMTLSYLDVRRARSIDLPPDDDFDLDLVPNRDDNCPLIRNSDQADINGDGFGDACSALDASGLPTVPDRDADGVPDVLDNCLWFFNPGQTDSVESIPGTDLLVADGIGDACQEVVVVFGPNASQRIEQAVSLRIDASRRNFLQLDTRDDGLDAGDATAAVVCDDEFTGCTFDASRVVLTAPVF